MGGFATDSFLKASTLFCMQLEVSCWAFKLPQEYKVITISSETNNI